MTNNEMAAHEELKDHIKELEEEIKSLKRELSRVKEERDEYEMCAARNRQRVRDTEARYENEKFWDTYGDPHSR